jgi:hypothetical protein
MGLDSFVSYMADRSLQRDGFICMPQVIDPVLCNSLLKQIRLQLARFIIDHHQINSKKEYFSAVNRWPLDKLIDKTTLENLLLLIREKLSPYINQSYELYEADVLYKSPIASLPTPCHQDISYVRQKPYSFSIWIALTEVTENDSALQFLPGSHQGTIAPAVDFWQPDYVDNMRNSAQWLSEAKTCPASAGDGLLFSSRLWHASLTQKLPRERFAIVLRWGNLEMRVDHIPVPIAVPFGMWNCGELTYQYLLKGLKHLGFNNITSLEEMIDQWQLLIAQNEAPFVMPNNEAAKALTQLKILHIAYYAYRGGDGQGIVYPMLWLEFYIL